MAEKKKREMTRRAWVRFRRRWNATRRQLLRHPVTGDVLRGPRWDQVTHFVDGWELSRCE